MIILVNQAEERYLSLREMEEKEWKSLLRSIDWTVEQLKINPQFGFHIPKRQIPMYYSKKYDVTNLWKCNLAHFWRLIYWIDGSQKEKIIVFILNIFDHEQYNRAFSYRSR